MTRIISALIVVLLVSGCASARYNNTYHLNAFDLDQQVAD